MSSTVKCIFWLIWFKRSPLSQQVILFVYWVYAKTIFFSLNKSVFSRTLKISITLDKVLYSFYIFALSSQWKCFVQFISTASLKYTLESRYRVMQILSFNESSQRKILIWKYLSCISWPGFILRSISGFVLTFINFFYLSSTTPLNE